MQRTIFRGVAKECRATRLTTSILRKVTRLDLPAGHFNAGLAAFGNDYICVHRPDEYSFAACILDKQFNILQEHPINIDGNCADPRILWVEDKLWMVWAGLDLGTKSMHEHIKGACIWDKGFIEPKPIRVSPPGERQKNWMPFYTNGKFYLIGTVRPHTIYEWDMCGLAKLVHRTKWQSPWFYDEFLRGNTGPVQLDDGNWLSTFHTAIQQGYCTLYDNGFYVFSGEPPFTVLRASNRSYLRAEDAVEPYFRKKDLIKVCFPVGMVREGERLLISYGDNDSSVKILDTTVKEALATTIKL